MRRVRTGLVEVVIEIFNHTRRQHRWLTYSTDNVLDTEAAVLAMGNRVRRNEEKEYPFDDVEVSCSWSFCTKWEK